MLGLWCTLSACGRSADDVSEEFEAAVAEANDCVSSSDCVLIFPGCPLGCFTAVNRAREAEVRAKADELIADYERGGAACAYSCIQPGALVCEGSNCAVLTSTRS